MTPPDVSSSPTVTPGQITSPTLTAQGLPQSAFTSGRFLGIMSSPGPPTAVTYGGILTAIAGDYTLDSLGNTWVCTVSGTPGTWTAIVPVTNGVVTAIADTAMIGGTGHAGTNTVHGSRIIVPYTGHLRSLAILVGTASGNAIPIVYDTGNTTTGSRTALWTGSPIALAGTNIYQILGDPDLVVTAGQQVDLAFILDNNTATVGQTTTAQIGALQYPTGYNVVPGGASPKRAWTFVNGNFSAPSVITEANCTIATIFQAVLGYISTP